MDKESKKEEEEESELEEKVDEPEDQEETSKEIINDREFNDFISQPIEISSIQQKRDTAGPDISQEIPFRLEKDLSVSQDIKKDDEEKNDFKYSSATSQEDRPKYQQNYDGNLTELKETQIEVLGKESLHQTQEASFITAQEKINSSNKEKYISTKSQNIEELGKNAHPFEEKEIKYKQSSNH